MLDIGWQELLVIGVLALLVVGPKELPKLLRTVGQWAGRARSMARDFQRSMEDAAREADLDEFRQLGNVKRDVEKMTRLDYSEQAKKAQSFMDGGTKSAAPGETPAAAATPAPTETPGAETVAREAAPATPTEPAPEPAPRAASGQSKG